MPLAADTLGEVTACSVEKSKLDGDSSAVRHLDGQTDSEYQTARAGGVLSIPSSLLAMASTS